MNKSQYQSQLSNNICVVTFTKKDGSERVMRCTLLSEIITENGLQPKGNGVVYSENQVRCIDVDIMEWRSFNVDSVVSFTVE
jgi:hypothetical protein